MKRTVEMERTRTETVEEEVVICDVCDCEVEGPRRTLSLGARLEPTEWAKTLDEIGRQPVAEMTEQMVARRARDYVELDSKAEFDVCEACIGEKFTPEVDLDV